jgi:hypothetical protein
MMIAQASVRHQDLLTTWFTILLFTSSVTTSGSLFTNRLHFGDGSLNGLPILTDFVDQGDLLDCPHFALIRNTGSLET